MSWLKCCFYWRHQEVSRPEVTWGKRKVRLKPELADISKIFPLVELWKTCIDFT